MTQERTVTGVAKDCSIQATEWLSGSRAKPETFDGGGTVNGDRFSGRVGGADKRRLQSIVGVVERDGKDEEVFGIS